MGSFNRLLFVNLLLLVMKSLQERDAIGFTFSWSRSIPAVVKQLSDQEMMVQSIIENLQRENLNPIEEARAYESLVEKGFTHAEIADKMGKSRPYISNSIRLLSLPEQILSEVENGKLSQAMHVL